MLFPASRAYHLPLSTTNSQYDTTTNYSSAPFDKWLHSAPESDFYHDLNDTSILDPLSYQYQSLPKRDNYLNDSFADISNAQYPRPRQEQSSANSTISPKRPTINYLLP